MQQKVEKRLFLIDGYGFVFRAYHSLPPLTNPAGTPVGAVYGFTNMLLKLKNRVATDNSNQTYAICVFDAGKKTFRNDIYPEYKANRPPAPEDLLPQFPLVREAAIAMNIPVMEMEGFEADDIIATYTRLAQQQGVHVTIVSSDKDLMQLITDDVKMYDSLREKVIGAEQVKEKFGVSPIQVLDALALMGDSSDNIPGVPGVGPKTAAELINQFGSLDDIYKNVESITKKKLKENLINFKNDAYLSKQLAALKNDVAVEEDIEKFLIKPSDKAVILPFLQQHGFKSLAAKMEAGSQKSEIRSLNPEVSKVENLKAGKLESWKTDEIQNQSVSSRFAQQHRDLDPDASFHSGRDDKNSNSQNNQFTSLPVHQITFSTRAEFAAWLPAFNEARKLAIVIARNEIPKQSSHSGSPRLQEKPYDDAEYTIHIAKSPTEVCILKPLENSINHQPSTNNNQQDLFSTVTADKNFKPYFEVLKPYLENTSCNFIFYDYKNYLKLDSRLHGNDTAPAAFDDILIMNYAVNGTTKDIKFDETINLAAQIFALHNMLEQQVFNERVNYIYHDIEKPLIAVLSQMEVAGIKVDKNILNELSSEFNEKIKLLEREIFVLAGEEFNIGSPKQLGEVLFEHMGIQGGKKTKSGGYTTDSDVLETLDEQGHSIAGKVLEWRSFSKLVSTYTDALAKEINPQTGRVHTTYRQAATTTGRLSSVDPNLQNIPIRTEEGRKIRKAFVAEKGNSLISIDYSQIELRLLAHVADIPVLKQAFKEGKDIHAATAAQVFGVDIDKVDGELRRRAKTINFGIIYGQSAFGLAKQLSIPRGEAKTLIDKYFAQYPGIKRYMDETIQLAHEQGYVSTIWGRKIHLPGINDKNAAIRNFNERAAINAPLQGTAADIIKRAMILIGKEVGNWKAGELVNWKAGKLESWKTDEIQNQSVSSRFAQQHRDDENSSSPNNQFTSSPKVKLLLQIHDELILECKTEYAEMVAEKCKKIMENVISLSVPLIADAKIGQNWDEAH